MTLLKNKKLIIGIVVAFLFVVVFLVVNLGNNDSQSVKNEPGTETPAAALQGSDDEGEVISEPVKALVFTKVTNAAKEYFSYLPQETTSERKTRLLPFFTNDSRLLSENPPSYASESERVSVSISGLEWTPKGSQQASDDINVLVTIDLNRANKTTKEAWVFMLQKDSDSWIPYDVLPFSDPKLNAPREND